MLLWYHPKKEEERGKLKEFLAAAKQVYTWNKKNVAMLSQKKHGLDYEHGMLLFWSFYSFNFVIRDSRNYCITRGAICQKRRHCIWHGGCKQSNMGGVRGKSTTPCKLNRHFSSVFSWQLLQLSLGPFNGLWSWKAYDLAAYIAYGTTEIQQQGQVCSTWSTVHFSGV